MARSGLDSTPQAITMRALSHNFSLEERARREEAQLNKDFFYGDQEKTLVLMNDDVEPVIMNFTKPIVSKRASMLYSRELKREIDGPPASVNYLEQVYEYNDIDQLLKRVDLLSELTGSCLVHPRMEENGLTKLLLWDATQFTGIGQMDDPMVPMAVSLIRLIDTLDPDEHSRGPDRTQPSVEREIRTQIWTPDSVVEYNNKDLLNSQENPYGFIPFVNFLGEEVPDQFVGWAPTALVRKANHHINQMLTHIGFMIKMQSHTPIVFKGYSHGEHVTVHPGRGVSLPADADAHTLSLNPKLMETLSVIEFLENRIYTTSSVPRISIEGGEGVSGRELMIRWHPLLQVFTEKATRFKRYELQLANTILAVAGLEPVADVNIEWPEEDILPLSAEEETLERDIMLNIKTPVDEILRRNPHLDPAEAVANLVENMQINAATFTNNEEEGQESS